MMRTAPSAAEPSENMMREKVTGSGVGSEIEVEGVFEGAGFAAAKEVED